jgi:hypothetical protein
MMADFKKEYQFQFIIDVKCILTSFFFMHFSPFYSNLRAIFTFLSS